MQFEAKGWLLKNALIAKAIFNYVFMIHVYISDVHAFKDAILLLCSKQDFSMSYLTDSYINFTLKMEFLA